MSHFTHECDKSHMNESCHTDLPPTVDIWCGICNKHIFVCLKSYVAVPYMPHLSQILTHCRPQVERWQERVRERVREGERERERERDRESERERERQREEKERTLSYMLHISQILTHCCPQLKRWKERASEREREREKERKRERASARARARVQERERERMREAEKTLLIVWCGAVHMPQLSQNLSVSLSLSLSLR